MAHPLGWGGGTPEEWAHVIAALRAGGFVRHHRRYLMWGHLATPPSRRSRLDVRFRDWKGKWWFSVRRRGHEIGELAVAPMRGTGWMPAWRRAWWIDWVYVEPTQRRRGVATAMFERFARRAARHRISKVAGATANPAAVRLNAAIGMDHRSTLWSFTRTRILR